MARRPAPPVSAPLWLRLITPLWHVATVTGATPEGTPHFVHGFTSRDGIDDVVVTVDLDLAESVRAVHLGETVEAAAFRVAHAAARGIILASAAYTARRSAPAARVPPPPTLPR